MNRTASLTALAAVATLTLAACTGTASSSGAATQNPAPTAGPSGTASEQPIPPTKPSALVGDCFYSTTPFGYTDASAPVACDKGWYTEKTLAV